MKELGDGELGGVGPAGQVLDRDDLGDPGPVGCPGAVHDEVDRLADEAVERGQREVVVGELADEPQPGEGLAGRAGVDGGEALHARRQRQQQRQRLPVADLADDGDVGGHAQEAGDEAAQVDRGPVGARRPGLHARDVRQRDVGLEDLLGDDDAQASGRARRAQHDSSVVLPEPGAPANTIDSRAAHARPRGTCATAAASMSLLDELVEVAERRRR